MAPKLRFDESRISELAAEYKRGLKPPLLELEESFLNRRDEVIARGWLKKDELLSLARWKAHRSAGHVETNREEYIKEITGFAFLTLDERARIEVLTVLDGVMWPMASVILHFFHQEPYPIYLIIVLSGLYRWKSSNYMALIFGGSMFSSAETLRRAPT